MAYQGSPLPLTNDCREVCVFGGGGGGLRKSAVRYKIQQKEGRNKASNRGYRKGIVISNDVHN